MDFFVAVAAQEMTPFGLSQDFLPGHIAQYSGVQGQLFIFRASVVEDHDLGMKRS